MLNQNNNALPQGTILLGNSYSYSIMKTLGQGSFGITYLAKVIMQGALGSLDTNMFVAIKEFFMKEINGREGTMVTSESIGKGGLFYDYKDKFAREAKNLSKLKHPNIVNVVDFFETNNTCYYVMEYLSGGELNSLIEKHNGLSEEETIRYTLQICSALSFMHKNKMLHLDLKPKNVMLSAGGDAILIDFGLSKQYDSSNEPESSTTVGRGTSGYAPLEQSNYQDGHGFPVTMDVYSLGATMFKMLTGVRPPDASVLLNDGFPDDIMLSHRASEQIINVVKKAMSPLKKDRYQSVEELIEDLSLCHQQEDTVIELPLSITDDVKSVEIYFDEGSIPNSHYCKFIVTKDSPTTFEIGQSNKKEDFVTLEYSIYNKLIDKFKDFRLSYTIKETGEDFCGGTNTRITIVYDSNDTLTVHSHGSTHNSFGTLHGDVDSLMSFLWNIPKIRESFKFVKYLEKVGDNGYAIYLDGNDAFKKGKQELAFKLFSISAEKGEPEGQNMLGYCYETGFGTNIDYDKAVYWYKRSADRCNHTAMFNLANAYKEGRGVSKDINKALRLYSQSAAHGNKKAIEMYNALIEQLYPDRPYKKLKNYGGLMDKSNNKPLIYEISVYFIGIILLASMVYAWQRRWSSHFAWGLCCCLIVLFSTIIMAKPQRAVRHPLLWCGVMVPFAAMQLIEFGPWRWEWQLHYWEKWLWEAPLIIAIYTVIMIISGKISEKFQLFFAIASIICALLMIFGW